MRYDNCTRISRVNTKVAPGVNLVKIGLMGLTIHIINRQPDINNTII